MFFSITHTKELILRLFLLSKSSIDKPWRGCFAKNICMHVGHPVVYSEGSLWAGRETQVRTNHLRVGKAVMEHNYHINMEAYEISTFQAKYFMWR